MYTDRSHAQYDGFHAHMLLLLEILLCVRLFSIYNSNGVDSPPPTFRVYRMIVNMCVFFLTRRFDGGTYASDVCFWCNRIKAIKCTSTHSISTIQLGIGENCQSISINGIVYWQTSEKKTTTIHIHTYIPMFTSYR